MKTYIFHVHGMHCKSCVNMIESELINKFGIEKVIVSLKNTQIEISGNFEKETEETLIESSNKILKPFGYTLSIEKEKQKNTGKDFSFAIPLAILFVFIFLLLQKFDFLQILGSSEINYSTAFIIGLIASVSSCMAVVGGLLLSFSANFAKTGNNFISQILFHSGRLISFFILGGLIGLIGSAFHINLSLSIGLGIITGLIMLILGINLLDIFRQTKRFQLTLPNFISKPIEILKKSNHTLTPFLIGIATFFLPCGFTQSMQIYALSTGRFVTASLIMLSFALGTLPVLALISFSSLNIKNKSWAGIFFKTAGLIVIFFAFFTLVNNLAALGVIPPIFSF